MKSLLKTKYRPNFGLWLIVITFIHFSLISSLISMSLHNEYYSHIPVIPFIAMYLIYNNRLNIFSGKFTGHPNLALLPLLILIILGIVYRDDNFTGIFFRSILLMSTVITIFWYSYGPKSFRKGVYPLFFLYLAVPLPLFVIERIVSFLQLWTTELTTLFFNLGPMPFNRSGFIFHFPHLTIEIAEQCSGIRSSIALLLTVLIASYLFLKSYKSRIILILFVIPLAILKNSIRVFTLTYMSIYIDPEYLRDGSLHSRGGIVFFLLTLIILAGVLVLLKRREKQTGGFNIIIPSRSYQ